MKKAKPTKQLIDIKQLEQELREGEYNEWDIEEIMKRAYDMNERNTTLVQKESDELAFSLKEAV